jgi:hypothetical protein
MKKRKKQALPYEAAAQFRKEFSKRICLHPQGSTAECSAQLIRAHSVSRSTSLLSIAEEGHVMQFDASMEVLIESGGRIVARRIGVNLASTFTGFCHRHDTSTFAAIDIPITALSEEQIFLLAYRAICR